MKNKKLISFILFALSSFAYATSEIYSMDFTVHFNTGNTYEVSIKGNSLAWTGVAGEDKDMKETVTIKHMTLSKNIEVFQWKEKRGYFDTFIVDTRNKTAITSTKNAKNEDWLVKGKITNLK
ncbi:hypothetical protein [Legionella sp. CNM-4043-24]|uniref:hypothetical protein n=1 Tax=Legionella sp. CNM-4043-24 TaxID=3421646 RepID=UPI00403B109F